jgi:tocopherol O-methyltransferase
MAAVENGQSLVDIGCGMGASSIHLAKTRGCECLGITISPVQRVWASLAARRHGVSKLASFRCSDAETIELDSNSRDLVWSIECTEHLFDKARFFKRAAAWIRPGGTMAICAWLAGDTTDKARSQQVYDVCEGFFCPTLGTMSDYVTWIQSAGLRVEVCEDWTARVSRTWEICQERVRRSRVRWFARLVGFNSVLFLDRFDTILNAYRSGAMQYGCLIARKPSSV